MKSVVLSLVFLFVVSLGVQAQSTPQKKDKPAATQTTTSPKKEKVKMEKNSAKKACNDGGKGCCSAAEKACPDSK